MRPTVSSGADGIYFPLVAGETTARVLAVQSAGPDRDDQDVQDPEWRRTMASAAVLVATAVQNVRLAREVEENGVYDGLTGCFNRTHTMRVLQSELQRARRQPSALRADHARPGPFQSRQRHPRSSLR